MHTCIFLFPLLSDVVYVCEDGKNLWILSWLHYRDWERILSYCVYSGKSNGYLPLCSKWHLLRSPSVCRRFKDSYFHTGVTNELNKSSSKKRDSCTRKKKFNYSLLYWCFNIGLVGEFVISKQESKIVLRRQILWNCYFSHTLLPTI